MSYFTTHASIRPSSICVYSKWEGMRNRNLLIQQLNKGKGYQKGVLTSQSSRKLKNALELLIYTANYKTVFVAKTGTYFRYKLNFITLTLPSKQIHSDNLIISLILSPFLESWAKHRKGFLYTWKAEVQANGNIHFHLLTNSFIHYKKLRKRWNKACEKLGYVTRSGIDDPNSTDVHALENKKNLAGYLVSYMNKKDIYSKALLRWLKMHKKSLADATRCVVHLPKNYFKHIKRSLNCRVWSASKLLLSKPPSFGLDDATDTQSYKMLALLQDHAIKTDFTYLYLLEDMDIGLFPELSKTMKKHYKGLIEEQSKNIIAESIAEL